MKYKQIKSFLCAALAASPFCAGAQIIPDEVDTDSLQVTSGEAVQVAYRKINENDLLGGVSFVNMEDLMKKSYSTYSLTDMQGHVGGWDGSNLWGIDGYLVLIDGVPRDANNVMPSEIEQITFLKGASAVVLYGSRAAKGVISITTKRGKIEERRIDVRANTGFFVPKSYPKYLGSAEYATLYNEARINDGLDPAYTPEQIYNYGLGANPYRYPDVDLYSSEFLKKAYNQSDVTAEISGGTEKARFYTNVNLYNTQSLLKYGDAKKDHITRFSVRGNIDVAIGKYVKAYADANATFYDSRAARGDFWKAAAELRPNRVSPLIPISYLMENDKPSWTLVNNSNHLIDGKYLLGGTQLDQTNAVADLYAAGYNTFTSRQYQFDMGVDIDLSSLLKGLSFNTQFAVDYATSYNKSYENTYATYEPIWGNYNGKDVILSLNKYGNDEKDGVQNVADSWNKQTISFTSQFNYNTKIADQHSISAMLIAAGYQQSESAEYHKTSNVNLGLQLDYNYQQKYYASLGGALVHSARLPKNNRQAFSPSVTLGWRISNEDFLIDSSVVDELMLTASASILHTDLDIADYYMYKGAYDQSNGAWWGWADGNLNHASQSLQGNNDKMKFIQRKEFSIGLRGSLLKKLFSFDASFFMNRMEGLLTEATTLYPNYFKSNWPESSFVPYINYNNHDRKGFDVSLNMNKRVGAVDMGLGVSGTYYTSKNARLSELNEYDYQNRTGHPTDGMWGLVTNGFFKDEADITSAPSSTYGEVKPGDIKYVDQNNDGVIDDKDIVYLGARQGSPFTLGVNLTLKWKDFTFFALGTGYFGGSAMKTSNYYWVFGDRKYSEEVRNRWTEATKETATYPRLTTQNNEHNFRASDFWMYKTDRFNLSKIQITYDLPEVWFRNSFVRNLSVYAYGTDLLTIAKEHKTLDLATGTSPKCRYYSIGVKVGF